MFAVALTVILAVQLAPVSASDCKHPFQSVGHGGESCLHISDKKAHYDKAKKDCKDLYHGKLVTAENSWRRDNLKSFVKNNHLADFAYIGGKEGKHKTFFWKGYSTAAFWKRNDPHAFAAYKASWRSGEPDNTNGNEQCVCVKKDGKWNDCKCKAQRRFICEQR